MSTRTLWFAVVVAGGILLSACGSSSAIAAHSSPSAPAPSAPPPSAPPTAQASGTAIDAASTRLGTILVDSSGRTLYLFAADKGATSVCYGQCAVYWPPVLTSGAPTAGAGVTSSLLGTSTRSDGTMEVTYHGHPLYYFISDKKPGDVTGQGINGFGGPWYVVAPSGMQVG